MPVYNVHNHQNGKGEGSWMDSIFTFKHRRPCILPQEAVHFYNTVSIICSKAGRFLFLSFTGCMRCPIVFEFRVKIRLKNRGFEEVKNCSKTSEVETERQMTFIPSTWRSRTQVMAILLTTNSGATWQKWLWLLSFSSH